MKLFLPYVVSIFAFYSTALPQTTIDLEQPVNAGRSLLFQVALEGGITGGELYDGVSDSPFQFGLRVGMHGFVSNPIRTGTDRYLC